MCQAGPSCSGLVLSRRRGERTQQKVIFTFSSTHHTRTGLAQGPMSDAIIILSPWLRWNFSFFLRQHYTMLYKYRKDKRYKDDVHMRFCLLMTFVQMYNSRWYSKYKLYHPRIVQCQFLVFGILWKLPEQNRVVTQI